MGIVSHSPQVACAPGFFYVKLEMNRIIFLIDGFNLYHALSYKSDYHKYKWLDLRKLAGCVVKKTDQVKEIYYFTAYATWSPDKVKRHKLITSAYQDLGIKVITGVFRSKGRKCSLCHKTSWTYEEKRTDVNIAIELFDLAMKDRFDTAIIVSGDSDLIPAIERVKTNFREKKVGLFIPIGRKAKELTKACDFRIKMKQMHLRTCQLNNPYMTKEKEKLIAPAGWTKSEE